MPRAAIDTGIIDVVLPVSELAGTLMKHAKHPGTLPRDPDDLSLTGIDQLREKVRNWEGKKGHLEGTRRAVGGQ